MESDFWWAPVGGIPRDLLLLLLPPLLFPPRLHHLPPALKHPTKTIGFWIQLCRDPRPASDRFWRPKCNDPAKTNRALWVTSSALLQGLVWRPRRPRVKSRYWGGAAFLLFYCCCRARDLGRRGSSLSILSFGQILSTILDKYILQSEQIWKYCGRQLMEDWVVGRLCTVWRWQQVQANQTKCGFAQTCKYVQIRANMCKYVQICAKMCKYA